MIEIKNLNLSINKNIILQNINLSFEEGKIYGLVGHNGCGKTMLMKCICGFVRPSSGEVLYDGKTIGKDLDYLLGAGVIIENPIFIPYFSGYRNLKLLASINHKVSDSGICDAMTTCGLDPDLKLSVKKYSMGMRQRLAIAQAIMEKPSILILDEPMNGIDSDAICEIRDLLLNLKKQGRLIVLSSHNADDIGVLCDVVIHLDKGCIQE